jgi:hypothetical protein
MELMKILRSADLITRRAGGENRSEKLEKKVSTGEKEKVEGMLPNAKTDIFRFAIDKYKKGNKETKGIYWQKRRRYTTP